MNECFLVVAMDSLLKGQLCSSTGIQMTRPLDSRLAAPMTHWTGKWNHRQLCAISWDQTLRRNSI